MSVGKIVANVVANTSGFTAGMKKAGSATTAFGATASKGVGAIAKLAAAATAAGGALAVGLVVQGLKSVDAQAKLARQLGGTQKGLVGLQRAAEDAGLSQEEAMKAAGLLNRRLGEAVQQGGDAAKALGRLGLNARELAAMDVDERFATIADAMQGAGMSAAEMASTLGYLGLRQQKVSVLMQGGGDAIRAATKEMEGYGVAVSDVDAAQIEALNDSMDRGKEVLQGVANQLAVRLAPVIQGVVDLLGDASAETGGFGGAMDAVISSVLKGVGWMMDRWADFKLGIAGLSVVGEAVRAAILSVMSSIAGGIEAALNSTKENINKVIKVANSIAGTDIELVRIDKSTLVKDLEDMATTAEAEVSASMERLQAMANEPLPSEGMRQWVADTTAAAREAAEAAVAARKDQVEREKKILAAKLSAEEKAAAAAQQKEIARRKEAAQAGLAEVISFTQSEVEAETYAHQQRLAALQDALDQRLITQEEYQRQSEKLEQAHQKNLDDIAHAERVRQQQVKSMWAEQGKIVANSIGSIAQSLGKNSKAAFAIQKAAAIASAIVSTYQGAAMAIANYPPPISFAMAGAQVAAGLAQVAAIKSQTFGGGGSGAARTGGAGAGAAAAATSGGGSSAGGGPAGGTLMVRGLGAADLFTGGVVSELAETLLEYQRNGGRVVLEA